MSCIKFPSSKSELTKMPSKENANDHVATNSQLIATAHQTFGQGNWSHAITSQTLDFVDYVNGKYQAGCASIVRVQLKSGEFHEAMGYYGAEGSTKPSAVQKVRLASFNDALKKAMMSFDSDIFNKVDKPSSRPVSPLPVESSVSVSSKINNQPRRSISPVLIEPSSSKLPKIQATVPAAANKIVDEAFEELIPMSQADAIMEIVDMDQLFEKDRQSDKIKVDVHEPAAVVPGGKDKKLVEASASSIISNGKIVNNNIDKKSEPNVSNGVKKETKSESSKSSVPTAMTEEEMRLERKRKQREMQEEFKRKQQKKMHTENGSKQQANPRY